MTLPNGKLRDANLAIAPPSLVLRSRPSGPVSINALISKRNANFVAVVAAVAFAVMTSTTFAQSSSPFMGRASCAASTCHGGVVDRGASWRHALTRWVASDPHAGAGLVLYSQRSEQIVLSLDPGLARQRASGDPGWELARDNLLRRRCVSCHATATPSQCEDSDTLLASSFLAEGVSCESCHGAAKGWLDPHIDPKFSGDKRFAPETGMRDTETIVARAQGCVRCHVGSRTEDGLVRDMNHDLIAAGHPALRFEMLRYDAALPQHWDASSAPRFYESLVRVRHVGRNVSLAAAAQLASDRARDHLAEKTRQVKWNDRVVPWPELSDYDCFACHQSLSMDQYALPVSDPGPELQISDGLPIWNSWHTVGLRHLGKDQLERLAPNSLAAESMAKGGAYLAKEFLTRAKALSKERFADPWNHVALLRTQVDLKPPRDWHEAAIVYLDLEAALEHLAQDDPNNEAIENLLHRFLAGAGPLLRFRAGFHSPADFDLKASSNFRDAVLELLPERLPRTQPDLTN